MQKPQGHGLLLEVPNSPLCFPYPAMPLISPLNYASNSQGQKGKIQAILSQSETFKDTRNHGLLHSYIFCKINNDLAVLLISLNDSSNSAIK